MTTLTTHTVSQQSLQPATLLINSSTHTTDQANYDTLRSRTPALSDSDTNQGHLISLTHLDIDLDTPSVHVMRPHSHTEHPQFSSISETGQSGVTVTYPTTLDSAPGSVPKFSPLQSPKKCTSTSPHGCGGGHGGHTEASSARQEPDSTARYEWTTSLDGVGREVTHVDTLKQGAVIQSILNFQCSET
jgi:hypothetical protein